ncbi:hypothetical protein DRO97_02370 [Archaeoglobales archaeon]|nr:MAG: hypothetical protein DRO97_02370 [Archaeoglobales archaeon]
MSLNSLLAELNNLYNENKQTKAHKLKIKGVTTKLERELKELFTAINADPDKLFTTIETNLMILAESNGLNIKTVKTIHKIFDRVVTEYVRIRFKTKFEELIKLVRN